MGQQQQQQGNDDARLARIARRQNETDGEKRVRQIVRDEMEDSLPGILESVLERFTSGGDGDQGGRQQQGGREGNQPKGSFLDALLGRT